MMNKIVFLGTYELNKIIIRQQKTAIDFLNGSFLCQSSKAKNNRQPTSHNRATGNFVGVLMQALKMQSF